MHDTYSHTRAHTHVLFCINFCIKSRRPLLPLSLAPEVKVDTHIHTHTQKKASAPAPGAPEVKVESTPGAGTKITITPSAGAVPVVSGNGQVSSPLFCSYCMPLT